MVYTNGRNRTLGGIFLNIEWISVSPGKVFIGSDNRSILFGGVGPRHEVKIDYDYEISYLPIDIEIAQEIIQSEDCFIASESEWTLAMENKLISGENEVEELSDKIRGSYWSKYCDGRPFIEENWIMKVCRAWKSGKPSISLIPRDESCNYLRLVRRNNKDNFNSSAPKLPDSSNKTRVLFEELLISLLFGIIPSFIWAHFNASPGYISEGWLNLVFGGLFIGVISATFWRPKTKSWRVGENCGKMKII